MPPVERTFAEQIGNIGSELGRAAHWEKQSKNDYREQSLLRVIELLDALLSSKQNFGRLRELTRLRELVADQLAAAQFYTCSLADLQRFCLPFALLARASR